MYDNLYLKFIAIICVCIFAILIYRPTSQPEVPESNPIIIADELPEEIIEEVEDTIDFGNPPAQPVVENEYDILEDDEYVHECEYEVAHQIWDYCTNELGLNYFVTAGILGNIMSETGGQTLNIKVVYWSKYVAPGEYYGICQWSRSRGKDIWGKGLEEQLELIKKEIKYEFNTYGRNYAKGFNYEQFTELTNEREAALAFAKCYERCSSSSYKARQNNATKALEHFVYISLENS